MRLRKVVMEKKSKMAQIHILKINENATLFRFLSNTDLTINILFSSDNLDFTYSIKRLFVVLVNCHFKHGLDNQHFVFIRQLDFTYSIIRLFVVLINCQYVLFKINCSKTSYLTPCNVMHERSVFLHRALLADWVDNIFPTSKMCSQY